MPSPSQAQNPENKAKRFHIGAIVRDLIIIWLMTAIGGILIGFTAGIGKIEPDQLVMAIALSNLLLGSVGFIIVGYLAPSPKWSHLFIVTLAAWLTSWVNVMFFNVTPAQWVLGAPFLLLIMAIGGGISSLFPKRKN